MVLPLAMAAKIEDPLALGTRTVSILMSFLNGPRGVSVLPQNVVAAARVVGKNIHQGAGNVDQRSSLVVIVIVDQYADNLDNVDGREGIRLGGNHVHAVDGR